MYIISINISPKKKKKTSERRIWEPNIHTYLAKRVVELKMLMILVLGVGERV